MEKTNNITERTVEVHSERTVNGVRIADVELTSFETPVKDLCKLAKDLFHSTRQDKKEVSYT